MTTSAYPDVLAEVVELFSTAPRQDKLAYLLEFAEGLPDLPTRLQAARERMEQVHECQSPVFLQSEYQEGHVVYFIDVPREAPTVRGFAGILYEGLNNATPAQIAAVPLNLYEKLGLGDVLSPLRLRGLTALLGAMQRQAARHAAEGGEGVG
ncbi:MAG: SufE family protein [Anaerolineales bacterium]|nr:SufE family protein [Anaerolineales bacterium]